MDSCNSKNSKSHKKLKNSINSNLSSNAFKKLDSTTLNASMHSTLDRLNKINFQSLNASMYSALDKLSKIDSYSLNASIYSALDKLNKIDFHSLNAGMYSALNTLRNIDFQSLNANMYSTLNKIDFNYLNEKLSSAFRKLDNSKLTSWSTQIFDNITIDSCNNVINNVNSIIPNITLENLEITQDDIDEDEKSHESSNFITKILTGTISFDDIKNKKIAVIIIVFILWFLGNISSFLLQDGYEYAKNYLKNNFFPEKEILTIEDYNNYRIIVTDILNIRQQPSTESPIIGKLYYLNVVKVIDEKPYWIKIEYKDLENDIYLSGWICKKHTKDFSDETKNLINLNSK